MSEFTIPPVPAGEGKFVDWMRGARRVMQEAMDYLSAPSSAEHTWGVPLPNKTLLGTPANAPTFMYAAGTLSGDFDYAYNYQSTEGDQQTALSPLGNTGAQVLKAITVSGDGSTDPRFDKVGIFRKSAGAGVGTYLQIAVIDMDDPWDYEDEAATSSLSVPPLLSETLLWTVCGPRFRLRRVKIAWSRDYDPDSAAYYEFWLAMRRDQVSGYEMITKPQNTAKVGLLRDWIYNVPLFTPDSRNPTRDLDLLVPEDAKVYLMTRGVGSVSPLPSGIAQVLVSRQEG